MKKLFHKAFYAICKFVCVFIYFPQGYRWHSYKPKSKNYIVLTNHTTYWDHFLVGLALPKQMYFVASEHIFRLGFLSKALVFLVNPIPRRKGSSGADTAAEMVRRLKEGSNVCMQAEGNRSFSGESGFVAPNTAKVVKEGGAGLITYKIHGGYFVNPRWSRIKRKGPTWGEVAGEYTKEQLAEMSTEEIQSIIERDLYVNAYQDQEKFGYEYKCEAPADGLENALFACPGCKEIACLRSEGDKLVCSRCGQVHTMDAKGYLHKNGKGEGFATILGWSRWEQNYLKEYIDSKAEGELLFKIGGRNLNEVHALEGVTNLAYGCVEMYRDRLVLAPENGEKPIEFSLADISSMAVSLVNTLLFTANGIYYEIKGQTPGSGLLVLQAYFYLTGRKYK